jgi:hypothetical protein
MGIYTAGLFSTILELRASCETILDSIVDVADYNETLRGELSGQRADLLLIRRLGQAHSSDGDAKNWCSEAA